jgi:hypothetical protein
MCWADSCSQSRSTAADQRAVPKRIKSGRYRPGEGSPRKPSMTEEMESSLMFTR